MLVNIIAARLTHSVEIKDNKMMEVKTPEKKRKKEV
jgi:hypothetical protein